MPNRSLSLALMIIPIAILSACGGGGGIASAPPPVGTPGATPTPPSATVPPPVPAGPIGLQGNQPFTTRAAWADGWGTISTQMDSVKISYSASEGKYKVSIPSEEAEGTLLTTGASGSFDANGWIKVNSTVNDVIIGDGPEKLIASVTLDWPASSPYSYTSFGSWFGSRPMGEDSGVFAYGIATSNGDVPVTGTASYKGEIRGLTNGLPETGGSIGPILPVFGSVDLSFNFGAGTLSGEMNPQIAPVWDPVSLGTYTFRDTVYSTGNSTFSGAFNVAGSTENSFFSGNFTGPQAAELMANWQAPFLYPGTENWGTMAGVWVAKKTE